MNCNHCEEQLSDYMEKSLAANIRTTIELHLKSCEACAELLSGMLRAVDASRNFPVHAPPPWLATRIIANTRPARESPLEARTALAIFTTALVVGWLGGGTAREAIFNRAESVMSCAFDRVVRGYYRSPLIIQIQSRLDRFMEDS